MNAKSVSLLKQLARARARERAGEHAAHDKRISAAYGADAGTELYELAVAAKLFCCFVDGDDEFFWPIFAHSQDGSTIFWSLLFRSEGAWIASGFSEQTERKPADQAFLSAWAGTVRALNVDLFAERSRTSALVGFDTMVGTVLWNAEVVNDLCAPRGIYGKQPIAASGELVRRFRAPHVEGERLIFQANLAWGIDNAETSEPLVATISASRRGEAIEVIPLCGGFRPGEWAPIR